MSSAPMLARPLLRVLIQDTVGRLPDPLQYRLFLLLKAARRLVRPRRFEDLLRSWDHVRGGDGAAGQGTLTVTHDVDYRSGFGFLPRLLDLDEREGVRATCFLLTRGPYRLDGAALRAMAARGHEIAVHGTCHDRALGARSPARIRRFLAEAKDELEQHLGPVAGFRAPALAVSGRVLGALGELGFRYDSSLCSSGLSLSVTSRATPFRIEEADLIEVPLTVQDSLYARDLRLTAVQTDALFSRLIERAEAGGWALVANFHPETVRDDPEGYTRILRLLRTSRLQPALMRELRPDGVPLTAA